VVINIHEKGDWVLRRPLVDANLDIMERDAKTVRKNKPYVLVNCKTDEGVDIVARHIIEDVLFEQPPKKIIANAK